MNASKIRIATFNVENLMERFDFSGWRNDRRRDRAIALKDIPDEDAFRALEMARTIASDDDARQMTALTLAAARADIVCLQEVENLNALEAFERNYLWRMTGIDYPQKVWLPGNDSRGIDVALMARSHTAAGEAIDLGKVRSHLDLRYGSSGLLTKELQERGAHKNDRVFRRDCLEVDLRIGGKPLTIYVCHFKSMGPGPKGLPGRDYTQPVRDAEARAVRGIVEKRFGDRAEKMRWVIAGDLNDYTERLVVSHNPAQFELMSETTSGLGALLDGGFCENLVQRRPADDRWTLYHAAGAVENLDRPFDRQTRHLVQLDYLLVSPALANANPDAVPDIVRSGQPHRVPFPPGQEVSRHPRTGWDRPKASDHCPVAVTLKID